MKPIIFGYGPSTRIATIHWYKDGNKVHETPCYTEYEIEEMLVRHATPGDLFNDFQVYVERHHRTPVAA